MMKIFKWISVLVGLYLFIQALRTKPFLNEFPSLLLPDDQTKIFALSTPDVTQNILWDSRPDCIQTSYNYSIYSGIQTLKRKPIGTAIYQQALAALSQFSPMHFRDSVDAPLRYFTWPRSKMRSRKGAIYSNFSKKNTFYQLGHFSQSGKIGLPYHILSLPNTPTTL